MGGFPLYIRDEALERAHYTCVACRQPGYLEVHHIIPKQDGGLDTIDNACPLCASCHEMWGGNPAKRSFLTKMRDWWWAECERRSLGPAGLHVNKKLTELLSTEGGVDEATLTEVKAVLAEDYERRAREVRKAESLAQVAAVSGIAVSQTGVPGSLRIQNLDLEILLGALRDKYAPPLEKRLDEMLERLGATEAARSRMMAALRAGDFETFEHEFQTSVPGSGEGLARKFKLVKGENRGSNQDAAGGT